MSRTTILAYLKGVERPLLAIMLGWCTIQFFSVDIIAHTTNDTVSYLNQGYDISKYGVIYGGYRQIGYPLFLRFCYELSAFLPADPFFLVVFFQRILLAAALSLAIGVLRVFSLPLILVTANPMTMSLTNSMYPEGLMVSLAILFGAGAVYAARVAKTSTNTRIFQIVFVLLALLYLVMSLVKLQIAPYGLVLVALLSVGAPIIFGKKISFRLIFNYFFEPSRRISSVALLLVSSVLGLFMVLATLENAKEYKTARPVTNIERSTWAGAWYIVFQINPNNRHNQALEEYYGGGSLFTFLHELECNNRENCKSPPYTERAKILIQRSDDMLRAASFSPVGQRVQSAISTVYGGRLDDQGSLIRKTAIQTRNCTEQNDSQELVVNYMTKSIGVDAFLELFNRGQKPKMLDGYGFPDWMIYHPRSMQQLLLIPFVIAIGLATYFRQTRLLTLSALGGFILFSAAAGAAFADVWRYVLPSWLIMCSVAFGGVQSFMSARFTTS